MPPVSVSDFRVAARASLPHFLFEYLDGGSYEEETLRKNRTQLSNILLRQRILCPATALDMGQIFFGRQARLPLVLAPLGLAGMFSRRGECSAARAAAEFGVPFCLSTVSTCSIEEVARASSAPLWFQLYLMRDRAFMRDVLAQAAGAGAAVLVFTVDMPVPGARYRDYRSGLAGSPGPMGHLRRLSQAFARPGWLYDVGVRGRPHTLGNVAPLLRGKTGLEDYFAWIRSNFDSSASWQDLEFVRDIWKGPIVLKGILDVDDARRAAELGVKGIVVSNHGGRQLDGVAPTCSVLPAIAEAVSDQLCLFVDGGVRSGLDLLKMLALGANGVLLGRAWGYALAAGGQRGVSRMLNLIEEELRVAMTLTGVSNVSNTGPNILSVYQ